MKLQALLMPLCTMQEKCRQSTPPGPGWVQKLGKASGTQEGAKEELVWSRSEVVAQVSIASTYTSKPAGWAPTFLMLLEALGPVGVRGQVVWGQFAGKKILS